MMAGNLDTEKIDYKDIDVIWNRRADMKFFDVIYSKIISMEIFCHETRNVHRLVNQAKSLGWKDKTGVR